MDHRPRLLPPHDLTDGEFQDGDWCGHTFSAFRDFAVRSGRAWFVIDADFGLGVLAPRDTAQYVVDPISADSEQMWLGSDQPLRRELLKARGRELMRVIPAAIAETILTKIIGRETVTLADLDYATGELPFDPRDRRSPISLLKRTARKAFAANRPS